MLGPMSKVFFEHGAALTRDGALSAFRYSIEVKPEDVYYHIPFLHISHVDLCRCRTSRAHPAGRAQTLVVNEYSVPFSLTGSFRPPGRISCA